VIALVSSFVADLEHARQLGLSWSEIATTLGVTRQAAWERRHAVEVETPTAHD
jgi:hypothetical protein